MNYTVGDKVEFNGNGEYVGVVKKIWGGDDPFEVEIEDDRVAYAPEILRKVEKKGRNKLWQG